MKTKTQNSISLTNGSGLSCSPNLKHFPKWFRETGACFNATKHKLFVCADLFPGDFSYNADLK